MLRTYVLSLLSVFVFEQAAAQDSSEAWVADIGAPQYFAVLVEDVDRSVAWYRSVFGLREVGGAVAADSSWRIENLRNERLFVEIIRDDRAVAAERVLGFRKVGFQVPDVEAVADRVGRMTGDRPRVIDFAQYGIRIMQIRDPEDNIIQLSSPLAREE
ncbi:MAG: VOC family protein [Bacteroidota bacterium]